MPNRYYCDYCDTYLTHDSPSVRKTHCNGRKHKENVKFYYQKWMEDQAQSLIDATTAAFKAGKMGTKPPTAVLPPPPMAVGRFPPPIAAPNVPGAPPRFPIGPPPPLGMPPPPGGLMPGMVPPGLLRHPGMAGIPPPIPMVHLRPPNLATNQ